MQAFGVRGGGAENVQTIQDLIAFLDTIQLSPEKSQSDAEKRSKLPKAKRTPRK